MICVSIGEKSWKKVLEILKNIEFAEIRLDYIEGLNAEIVDKLFSQKGKRLIATYRAGKEEIEFKRDCLMAAIKAGAEFVDLEVDLDHKIREEIACFARRKGCKIILSYHNYEYTPHLYWLLSLAKYGFSIGADLFKIACQVKNQKDSAVLLALLGFFGERVIVVGMGEKGKLTRIIAPLLGAPFTFASAAEGRETAKGQLPYKELKRELERLKKWMD